MGLSQPVRQRRVTITNASVLLRARPPAMKCLRTPQPLLDAMHACDRVLCGEEPIPIADCRLLGNPSTLPWRSAPSSLLTGPLNLNRDLGASIADADELPRRMARDSRVTAPRVMSRSQSWDDIPGPGQSPSWPATECRIRFSRCSCRSTLSRWRKSTWAATRWPAVSARSAVRIQPTRRLVKVYRSRRLARAAACSTA